MKKIVLNLLFAFQAVALLAAPDWNVDANDYEFSMTITGAFLEESTIEIAAGDMLGAFVGDECRGYAVATYDNDYEVNFFYLTVFSNEFSGEEISFKLYSETNDDILEEFVSVDFEDGQVIGTNANPFSFEDIEIGLSEKTEGQLKLFPNPVINTLHIASKDNIEYAIIVNSLGQKVMDLPNVDNTIDVSVLNKGTYVIEVFSQTQKKVVQFVKL